MKNQQQLSDTEKVLCIINNWAAACEKLSELIQADAKKEFGDTPRIGFGLDGDEEVRNADFDAVRGTFESNSFVREVRRQQEQMSKTAQEWINKIKSLSAK